MKILYIEDILKILPHRYPFVLIDRVTEYHETLGPSRVGQRVKAIKNVSFNEAFFTGHFPHRPVMPGVLILESLAQAGAVACHRPRESARDVAIGRLSDAKFRRPVVPGDVLQITAEVTRDRGQMIVVEARAEVDGQLVTEVEILAHVTQIFKDGVVHG
jgi:3-hydroxyacyl-[acyl-carrier-protein] dehydratase